MSIYEIITEQILKKLEAGEIPWHKPWTGGEYPKNLVSKKEYRGINLFLLDCQKYSSPFWLTYKQATDLGGFVRPGEKGSIENSAAYIQSWLKALKNDSKMVVLAAAQAQRAADYIQGIKYEN
jgi:antirestriction protein ArdC